jgi:hypothetical protein
MNIFKDNEIFEPTYLAYSIQLTSKGYEFRKFENELIRDSLKQELNDKYLKEKISKEKSDYQKSMSFLIIHPGEIKFFSYYKTLPIFLDNMDSYYMYKFSKNENYHFQISIKNNADTSRKNLNINQAKEIEANGYSIFNGTINSNKIPIKFANMGKNTD